MKRLKIISVLLLVAVMVTSTAIGCGGGKDTAIPTDKRITLRLAHEWPAHTKIGVIAQEFADRVMEATDGKVTIEVFPHGSLSKGFALWTDTVRGLVDIAVSYDYVLVIADPWLYLGGTPGLFTTWDQGYEFLQHPQGGQRILGSLETYGAKGIALYPATNLIIHLSKDREIKTWHDFKGLRQMGYGGDVEAMLAEITGMKSVFISPAEVYSSLAQGLLDVVGTSIDDAARLRMDEVTRYGYIWVLGVQNAGIWMDLDVWNKLPATYQETILQVAQEMDSWVLQFVKKGEQESLDYLSQRLTLHRESEQDRAELLSLWEAALEKRGYYQQFDPELLALARQIAGRE